MAERRKILLAFLLGIILATAGTATAAKLITGKDIKNGTITAKDLSNSLRKKLNHTGKTGKTGATGPSGATGPAGTIDVSNFYDKGQSDSRFLKMKVVNVTGTDGGSVPPFSTLTFTKLTCPAGTIPGKGTFEVIDYPANLILEDLGPTGYEVSLNNVTNTTVYGTVKMALSCIGIDLSGAPEPTLP
ncbi:MAG: hypothetical protein KDB54_07385 [Solirubrobacterales bacterium]|nr:hypothetical protein [Solirubrobacterales bacterium]HRV59445.1 hypothetical protein [Solirubrobacterales bacterium]